jgi:biopolymer transport protein TolR
MAMDLSGGGRKDEVRPTMNVTPLVDVVLVLLIIFMVVTPLLTKQFWLNLPKKDDSAKEEPPPPENDGPVVLSVEKGGTVRLNRAVVERAELEARLARVMAARKDQILYFDADDDAPYGLTVEIMDLARRGGARSIAILTEKPGS